MSYLEKLILQSNENLKDISAIKNLVNLKEIDLGQCDLNNLELLILYSWIA